MHCSQNIHIRQEIKEKLNKKGKEKQQTTDKLVMTCLKLHKCNLWKMGGHLLLMTANLPSY